MAAQNSAVAVQPALEHAGPGTGLERGELAPSEALRPIRYERSVRGAGDGILVDPDVGDEDSAGDVLIVARRRDDGHTVDLLERREIRANRAHRIFVWKLDDGRVV